MKQVEGLSNEWHVLRAAETLLFASRTYLRNRNDFISNMTTALNMLSEQGAALRLMIYDRFIDSELTILMPIVIDIAVEGNVDSLVIARGVLSRYKNRKVVRSIFENMVDKYFSAHDDWTYRRLAELLVEVGYGDILKKLMFLCKNNGTTEFLEIYEDYSNFQGYS